MSNEQQQLLQELQKIEQDHPGHIGTIAWRARQEIESLISQAKQSRTAH